VDYDIRLRRQQFGWEAANRSRCLRVPHMANTSRKDCLMLSAVIDRYRMPGDDELPHYVRAYESRAAQDQKVHSLWI